jgi:importin subunit beta-1
VHEEAMLDIGALAYATGPDFLKYMPEFHRYLDMGLQNCGAYLWVWLLTSGVPWMKIYSLTMMVSWALLNDLSSPELHYPVNPLILSCIGDIALMIVENSEKYVL